MVTRFLPTRVQRLQALKEQRKARPEVIKRFGTPKDIKAVTGGIRVAGPYIPGKGARVGLGGGMLYKAGDLPDFPRTYRAGKVKTDTGEKVPVYEITTTKGTVAVAGTATYARRQAKQQIGGTLVTGGIKRTGEVTVYGADSSKEARNAVNENLKKGTITEKGVVVKEEGEETSPIGIIKDVESGEFRACPAGACPGNIQVKIYEFRTDKGTFRIPAANADQAKRLIEEYHGAKKFYSGGRIIEERTVTPQQAWDKIQNAAGKNQTLAAEAMLTYAPAIGAGYIDPSLVPIRTDEGVVYITNDAANQLQKTEGYTDAKGTTTDRLGVAFESSQKDFEKWLKQLERDYPNLYKTYQGKGFEGITEHIEQQKQILSKLESYKKDEGYDVTAALINKAITPNELKLCGFADSDIEEVKEWLGIESKFKALSTVDQANTTKMARGQLRIYAEPYEKMDINEKLQVLGYYKEHGVPSAWDLQKKYAQQYSLEPMMAITPVAGTVYFWDKMSPEWKAISIATDVLCLAFVVKAAAASARAARGYTAGARIKAAARGAGEMVLAEITAPGEMIAHPIETTKGIGRQIQSAIETLVHPKKIPLGATELTYTSTRLPVKDVGGATKAMQLRDAAVNAAIQGKKATATVGDITLTLTPAELQKVGGAMAIHATPDIRPYMMNGAVVKGGAEGSGLFISPQFHSRFSQSTAFGDIPQGGIKGGLIIRDPKVLKAIAPSGKIYRGAVEIEAILKPGTVLPAPSQILFTRDVAGHKLTFLVIGKPFTPSQVAKLKFLGSMDTIGQIFKPTMKLTGAQRTAINAMDDIITLSKERATIVRQLDAARAAGRVATARELGQHLTRIDGKISELVNRVNAPREVVRPSDIIWGQYDKGLLERWRGLNPREARATPRGTRLPDIRVGQAIRRASLAREERGAPVIERKAPAGVRRASPEGRRAAPEAYRTPTYPRLYTPSYVPPYVPPYVPSKTPPKTPPSYAPYVPPRITREAPFKAPPSLKQPRVEFGPVELGRERIPRERQGLVSWRQGRYWVSIFEPFRTTGTKPDVVYSRHKPPWGKVAKGRHSPRRTLHTIGKVPQVIDLPMGVVKVRVQKGKTLKFLSN